MRLRINKLEQRLYRDLTISWSSGEKQQFFVNTCREILLITKRFSCSRRMHMKFLCSDSSTHIQLNPKWEPNAPSSPKLSKTWTLNWLHIASWGNLTTYSSLPYPTILILLFFQIQPSPSMRNLRASLFHQNSYLLPIIPLPIIPFASGAISPKYTYSTLVHINFSFT